MEQSSVNSRWLLTQQSFLTFILPYPLLVSPWSIILCFIRLRHKQEQDRTAQSNHSKGQNRNQKHICIARSSSCHIHHKKTFSSSKLNQDPVGAHACLSCILTSFRENTCSSHQIGMILSTTNGDNFQPFETALQLFDVGIETTLLVAAFKLATPTAQMRK